MIVRGKHAQKLEHLHLQEGIRNTTHVVLALESSTNNRLHLLNQTRNQLAELGNQSRALLEHILGQSDRYWLGWIGKNEPLIRTP